jgi:glycosyltransferase involved in cell wall biosynthesis
MRSEKIKLLFVNDSLALAGGEKSLVSLLSNLDENKYEIDLQLFRYGCELESQLPKYVNLLPEKKLTVFMRNSLGKTIKKVLNSEHAKMLISRLRFSIKLRTGKTTDPAVAQIFWETLGHCVERNPKKYHVAIAYSQGVPTFYVNEKVFAAKKIAWVNANLEFDGDNTVFQRKHYASYDKIVTVSEFTRDHMRRIFPEFRYKIATIYDLIDYKNIVRMAEEKISDFSSEKFTILTVARLVEFPKGFRITLETCKLLKEKGLNFHWYVIGDGTYRCEMVKFIAENHLENYLTLLGRKINPYPYFKKADLYVQTSYSEGFGLSIAEARMLNTPVVTTKYDSVNIQIFDGENGLVTKIDPECVAKAIEKLMNDRTLYSRIVSNLKKEQKENTEPITKFDKEIGSLGLEVAG